MIYFTKTVFNTIYKHPMKTNVIYFQRIRTVHKIILVTIVLKNIDACFVIIMQNNKLWYRKNNYRIKTIIRYRTYLRVILIINVTKQKQSNILIIQLKTCNKHSHTLRSSLNNNCTIKQSEKTTHAKSVEPKVPIYYLTNTTNRPFYNGDGLKTNASQW